jgi:predicted kinase
MPPITLNTRQQTAFILVGLPGSGKSSWALQMLEFAKDRKYDLIRFNKDEIREELLELGESWTKQFEDKVRKTYNARVEQALRDGHSVILDNTHLNKNTLRQLKTWLEQNFKKVVIEEVDFTDVPVYTCIDRDREREARGERFVGAQVILKMAHEAGLEEDTPQKEIDWSLPFAIVSDLDGTLALFGNRRNPFDASQCDLIDQVNFPVASVLRSYLLNSNTFPEVAKIFFFSGRTDKYKEPTKRFLLKAGFDADDPFFDLVMRQDGDYTADEIIKEQMYRDHIEGKYNVLFIFDDRPKVVRMWKRLGLPVFNVGGERDF